MNKHDIHEVNTENKEFMNEETLGCPSDEAENEMVTEDKLAESEAQPADNTDNVAAIDWQDRFLRLSAEFDNYRKRTLKEKMDLIATGGEDVIKSFLSVVDDMDRAVEAMDKSDDIESARAGMKLIQQKMVNVLKQKGVTEIPARDLPLDTDVHEAVANFPCEADKKGKIIDVVRKGYKMKDKVIRFCKVVVGE